jgi:hypothetical protein
MEEKKTCLSLRKYDFKASFQQRKHTRLSEMRRSVEKKQAFPPTKSLLSRAHSLYFCETQPRTMKIKDAPISAKELCTLLSEPQRSTTVDKRTVKGGGFITLSPLLRKQQGSAQFLLSRKGTQKARVKASLPRLYIRKALSLN